MHESAPAPRIACSARCTHVPCADINRRYRERPRNTQHHFGRVVRRCIGRTDTELAKVVLAPTPHRAVGENCACIRTTRRKLRHRAAHCNLYGIKLSGPVNSRLAPTITTPAPHCSCTGENTDMISACHHFCWRSNSPIPEHASTHGQQTFSKPRMIRATELALIIATPTPHRVIGFDRTRECSTGCNAVFRVYGTRPRARRGHGHNDNSSHH